MVASAASTWTSFLVRAGGAAEGLTNSHNHSSNSNNNASSNLAAASLHRKEEAQGVVRSDPTPITGTNSSNSHPRKRRNPASSRSNRQVNMQQSQPYESFHRSSTMNGRTELLLGGGGRAAALARAKSPDDFNPSIEIVEMDLLDINHHDDDDSDDDDRNGRTGNNGEHRVMVMDEYQASYLHPRRREFQTTKPASPRLDKSSAIWSHAQKQQQERTLPALLNSTTNQLTFVLQREPDGPNGQEGRILLKRSFENLGDQVVLGEIKEPEQESLSEEHSSSDDDDDDESQSGSGSEHVLSISDPWFAAPPLPAADVSKRDQPHDDTCDGMEGAAMTAVREESKCDLDEADSCRAQSPYRDRNTVDSTALPTPALTMTCSWDTKINREIEEARRAATERSNSSNSLLKDTTWMLHGRSPLQTAAVLQQSQPPNNSMNAGDSHPAGARTGVCTSVARASDSPGRHWTTKEVLELANTTLRTSKASSTTTPCSTPVPPPSTLPPTNQCASQRESIVSSPFTDGDDDELELDGEDDEEDPSDESATACTDKTLHTMTSNSTQPQQQQQPLTGVSSSTPFKRALPPPSPPLIPRPGRHQYRIHDQDSVSSSRSTVMSGPDERRLTEASQQEQRQHHQTASSYSSHHLHGPIKLTRSLSMTESDVGSVDGLPSRLQSRLIHDQSHREAILMNLDGIQATPKVSLQRQQRSADSSTIDPYDHADLDKEKRDDDKGGGFFAWPLNFLWGDCGREGGEDGVEDEGAGGTRYRSRLSTILENDDTLAILGCSNIIHREEPAPAIPSSLVRVTSEPPPPSYAETIHANEVDPRMQAWVDGMYAVRDRPPRDGSYHLGKSRTVIVHEIVRGNWTWCTAWSPDGDLLAIATENHHLAVVDTTSSTVWRVLHDQKISGPVRNHTTHSIRSIAWGAHFIAIGGTGNAVSILAPTEPYSILHTIKGTGFVGSLHWKVNSNVLAIASRLDKAMLVRIKASSKAGGKQLESEILHTIELKHWANCIAFSPGGTCLAVGDAGGSVSVYSYHDDPAAGLNADDTAAPFPQFHPTRHGAGDNCLSHIQSFTMEDSVLTLEWSPDGKWLYAGGEDFNVTVIDTNYWEVIHKINRNRWVQCISSSNGGTHIAVGGVSSEISILDVKNGWDSVMGVELKGLVPLSAKWHPKDQYLTITGQNNNILAVETTNARHVKGHHLYSISSILAIKFSPDGRMAVVGNESGVVTFFSLSGSTFVTAYELVVTLNNKVTIDWSLNGLFVVLGTKDAVIVVKKARSAKPRDRRRPPNASGFSVAKVFREFGEVHCVSIDPKSHYVAVSGETSTWILDATRDYAVAKEFKNGPCLANAWSPDSRWLATIGRGKLLAIYDTSDERVSRWRGIFSLKCDFVGCSLSWGPRIVGGLLYLAYGGDDQQITIMEIRTHEGTWETVLRIPRDGSINGLDWSTEGLLAAAVGNGTVSVANVSYLQSGIAVNEMDYNWQRQALTCFTEVRRNRGVNAMRCARWIPSAPGSDSLLAVGGTDGEVEIVDLTERRRCRSYVRTVTSK